MTTAKNVAYELFEGFVKAGMLNTSQKTNALNGMSINPASTSDSTSKWIQQNNEFINTSVQAVGYEEYDDDDDERKGSEAVYLYMSNGNDRSLHKIEREKDGIPIRVRKLSPIVVKPKASLNMSATFQLFIGENSEISCGSSCSPVNANYSWTIETLIRRKDDNTIIMSPAPSDD